MILLNSNLEANIHNENLMSIRDIDGDVDISHSKWGFLFDDILARTNAFYFIGYRLEYLDSDFESLLNNLSDKVISKGKNYVHISFKIKPLHLIINRKQLSNLWLNYESLSIFFLENESIEEAILHYDKLLKTYKEIIPAIGKYYRIYKSFEFDVLWVEKSNDIPSLLRL